MAAAAILLETNVSADLNLHSSDFKGSPAGTKVGAFPVRELRLPVPGLQTGGYQPVAESGAKTLFHTSSSQLNYLLSGRIWLEGFVGPCRLEKTAVRNHAHGHGAPFEQFQPQTGQMSGDVYARSERRHITGQKPCMKIKTKEKSYD